MKNETLIIQLCHIPFSASFRLPEIRKLRCTFAEKIWTGEYPVQRRIWRQYEYRRRQARTIGLHLIDSIAVSNNITNTQVTLAWLLVRKPGIGMITGSRKRNYLEQNEYAVDIDLTQEDLNTINDS